MNPKHLLLAIGGGVCVCIAVFFAIPGASSGGGKPAVPEATGQSTTSPMVKSSDPKSKPGNHEAVQNPAKGAIAAVSDLIARKQGKPGYDETEKLLRSDLMAGRLSREEQVRILDILKKAGMDSAGWETLVSTFANYSNDAAFRLELASMLDSGEKKSQVLSKAFKLVTKDNLPLFTRALESVHNDGDRKKLVDTVLEKIVDKDSIQSSLDWVNGVADQAERDAFTQLVADRIGSYLEDPAHGYGQVTYQELKRHFSDQQLYNLGQVYGPYYASQGDMESLKAVFDGYSAKSALMDVTISGASSITAKDAVEIKRLIPEDDKGVLLKQLIAKVRTTEGAAAADRFISQQLTPEQQQSVRQ